MNPVAVGMGLAACLTVAMVSVYLLTRPLLHDPSPEVPAPDEVDRDSRVTKGMSRLSDHAGRLATRVSTSGYREWVRTKLAAAGSPAALSVTRFIGLRVLVTASMGSAGVTFVAGGARLTGSVVLLAGLLSPDLWLAGEARRRQTEIERQLPALVDIVSVGVAANVPLKPALAAAADVVPGVAADEVKKVLGDVEIGGTLIEALQAMQRRNPSQLVGSVAGTLIDTLQLGTPLAPALTVLARDARHAQHEIAIARASRLAPRVAAITALTLVPATLIILVTSLLVGSEFSLTKLTGP